MRKLITILLFFSAFSLNAGELKLPYDQFEFGGFSLDSIEVDASVSGITFFVTAPASVLDNLGEFRLEELSRFYIKTMVKLKLDYSKVSIMARRERSEDYRPVTDFLPESVPVPKKELEDGDTSSVRKKIDKRSLSPQVKIGEKSGFLSGKTLFVSAGHGWVYNTSLDKWVTQRDISNHLIEDDSNAETVTYFLIPYLRNAGGTVFPVRESDRQENMVIVDDEDGLDYESQDGIFETSGSWTLSESSGYGRVTYPISINVNPLKNGGYRFANISGSAWARWTANIPQNGKYHVYVAFKRGDNRADAVRYKVNHAGGTTEVTVNQQHHGSTWIDIGEYYFNEGLSREKGSVLLQSVAGAGGSVMIADAVRFGGGKAALVRNGKTSDKPRWEEAAAPNVQFLGGSKGGVYQVSSNDRDDDIQARSRYAAWENEEGYDDSLYIAFHSNAGGGEGISTYIYNSNYAGGAAYVTGEETAGSVDLANFVHDRILAAEKALFKDGLKEYGNGLYSAYFGEINSSVNPEMPSILVELAFHDHADDSARLRDPKFRDIAARAAYQGIVQYFAAKDGSTAVFLPGSPQNLAAVVRNDGKVRLSWSAPEVDPNRYLGDAATGYIVQTSTDGLAFNDGVDVGNVLDYTFEPEEGTPVYFRVVAYNTGGYSFPSAVAGAVAAPDAAKILVVDGFERLDAALPRFSDQSNGEYRYLLEFINSFDYVKQYAPIFGELGLNVDFVQRKVFADLDPDDYAMIVWFAGEQSTADETLTHDEQEIISGYLTNGGAFFISGAEIGWDLDRKGDSSDKFFFNNVLNAAYVDDDSNLYSFYGADIFSAISGEFDDGSLVYQPEYPDVLKPYDESLGSLVLFYDPAASKGAMVLTKSTAKKAAVLGFPFETIVSEDLRKSIIVKLLNEFEIEANIGNEPVDTGDTTDSDETQDSGDTTDSDETQDSGDTTDSDETQDSGGTTDSDETQDSGDITDSDETQDSGDISDSGDDAPEKVDHDGDKGGKGCSAILI
ncbi:N-acetylmuramoyl-L-alanine amidase [bacterium]|nr:N-acetylmuramoyl-L-alanine amidase [bacterium]MBP5434708.1 N-acetylmuramoyl-L-alanine amidase [bacterium]